MDHLHNEHPHDILEEGDKAKISELNIHHAQDNKTEQNKAEIQNDQSKNSNSEQSQEEFEDLAKGCIFGAFIGDAIGAFLEFQSQVNETELELAMQMPGGGPFEIGPGQVTDDSELAQSLMHGLLKGEGVLDLDCIAEEYGKWYGSRPFDMGITIRNAVKPASQVKKNHADAAREGSKQSAQSQSNGGLMRITPLAVWVSKLKRSECVKAVWEETRLTHPNQVALNASILYVSVIHHLLNNKGDHKGAYKKCIDLAVDIHDPDILSWINELERGELPVANKLIGWLKIAFLHSLYYLKNGTDYVTALRELLGKAGDTDTNLAIVGGVLGALHGFKKLPKDYIDKVLDIDNKIERPDEWLPGTHLVKSIDELIKIRPSELKMRASESQKYENVDGWKGPPQVSD